MDEKEISDLRSDGLNDFNFPWICHPGSPKAGNRRHPADHASELSRSIEEMISHGVAETRIGKRMGKWFSHRGLRDHRGEDM